ncbi:MAG: hypothetical protein VYE68_12230 [Acidobacteriota bacterium]|nr:hypothetical protein [Acidobacteriota bacterium]
MGAYRCGLVGILMVGMVVSAFAQYGHPLKGSWSGDWGADPDNRTRLLLLLDWDGTAITGTINPGPQAVDITTASLDPTTWAIHFEAIGEDDAGEPVAYVIDGELQNLGSYNRVITGMWMQGDLTGAFTLTRN